MERINETIENRPYPCSYCGAINIGRESETTVGNEIQTECTWSCSRCGNRYKQGVLSIKKVE